MRLSLGALVALAAGCATSAKPPIEVATPLPPLVTHPVDALLAAAGLRWVVLVEPRTIASTPWLIPEIGSIVPEENFDRFEASSGLDLRQLPEAVVASYDEGELASLIYLARHRSQPRALERALRTRITAEAERAVDRPDVIRVTGKIGVGSIAMAVVGPDLVGYQVGGNTKRGPVRIASLYAQGALRRSPSAFAVDPLRSLSAHLGSAPLRAFAVGPFEGELQRGLGGLLAGATAVGGVMKPTAREGLALTFAASGDFTSSGAEAESALLAAWNELAGTAFGKLYGLDHPMTPPTTSHADDAVLLAIELDPKMLAHGLAAATSARIDEIMR